MKRPTIKIQYDAPCALTFALICVIALVWNNLSGGWANENIFSVYRSSFADPFTYVRMFFHVFGHQDFSHFFNNISKKNKTPEVSQPSQKEQSSSQIYKELQGASPSTGLPQHSHTCISGSPGVFE